MQNDLLLEDLICSRKEGILIDDCVAFFPLIIVLVVVVVIVPWGIYNAVPPCLCKCKGEALRNDGISAS